MLNVAMCKISGNQEGSPKEKRHFSSALNAPLRRSWPIERCYVPSLPHIRMWLIYKLTMYGVYFLMTP